MSDAPSIRRLRPDDAPALRKLRRDALIQEPLAFKSSPEDDRCASLDFLRAILGDEDEQAVFGAFDAESLVGMVGALRAPRRKLRHRVDVWGVFVLPAHRGRGLARALLAAAIEQARAWPGVTQVHLGVSSAASAAARLYEGLGFVEWGTESHALQHEGTFADERHLVLELACGAPAKSDPR